MPVEICLEYFDNPLTFSENNTFYKAEAGGPFWFRAGVMLRLLSAD